MTRSKGILLTLFLYAFFTSLRFSILASENDEEQTHVRFELPELGKLIVITGASGHVGISLIEKLLSEHENIEIRALFLDQKDRLDKLINRLKKRDIKLKDRLKIYKVDLLTEERLDAIIAKADAIIHLAAVISIQNNESSINLMKSVNIQGTKNLLEATKKSGVKHFIHCSSTHAYAHLLDRSLTTKNGLVNTDVWDYNATKAQSQMEVQSFARENPDFKYVIVAPSGIIGRHDHENTEMWPLFSCHYVTRFAPIPNGQYAFVDVRQVCDLISESLMKLFDDHERDYICGQEFIVHGQVLSIAQLVSAMQSVTKRFHCLNYFWSQTPVCLPLSLFSAVAPLYACLSRKPLVTNYSIGVLSSLPHGVAREEDEKLEKFFGDKIRKYSLLETIQDRYDSLKEDNTTVMNTRSLSLSCLFIPIFIYASYKIIFLKTY